MSSHTKSSKRRKDTHKSGKPQSKKEKRSKDKGIQYVDLFCAIYDPRFGNFYHWAFAINDPTTGRWRLFEVVQDVDDGPFTAIQHAVNPTNSGRCRRPLTYLGQMHPSWWDAFIRAIADIAVPGDGLSWNCQDYVMDIWELMLDCNMITAETWDDGRRAMMPYFGPNFGGGDSGDDESGGDYDEGSGEDNGQESRVLSEEFVQDSGSD